jgi:hypothetical protein
MDGEEAMEGPLITGSNLDNKATATVIRTVHDQWSSTQRDSQRKKKNAVRKNGYVSIVASQATWRDSATVRKKAIRSLSSYEQPKNGVATTLPERYEQHTSCARLKKKSDLRRLHSQKNPLKRNPAPRRKSWEGPSTKNGQLDGLC